MDTYTYTVCWGIYEDMICMYDVGKVIVSGGRGKYNSV